MNEIFVPIGQENVKPTPMTTELKANLELAKVLQDNTMLALIQRTTQLKQLQQFNVIETDVQYSQAIDSFDLTKKTIKELENIRHEYVDFPTKVTQLINNFFRDIRVGVEKTKRHLGIIIDKKKQADVKQAEREQKLHEETGAVVVDTPDEDVKQVVMDKPEVVLPENVIKSERGAKVHTRSDTSVEIIDFAAFLKVCAGKNKRFKCFQSHKEELININHSVLKRLVKDGKKRSVPGLVIKQVTITI